MNGIGHISVYLAIVDTAKYTPGWEVNMLMGQLEDSMIEDLMISKMNGAFTNFYPLNISKIVLKDTLSMIIAYLNPCRTLLVYPKGIYNGEIKAISLFLFSCDCVLPEHNFFAEFKIRIKDQVNNAHVEKTDKHWFTTSSTEWRFPHFMPLKDLQDASKGLLMNDALIIEGEIIVMSNVK
ncbi:ubiquitin C-terminal hydrolase 13-like [Quercus robur]|uniref:ubiquitin C-terminal hydrolase 13-like n=1 Tax=Quercus robur TaxID=38942 RepID=UPI0021636982|nr:ubiquitin C-terminal hydrolase 13-like [Quercus robur]